MNIVGFVKNWALPLAMAIGATLYFAARELGLPENAKEFCTEAISYIQPMLIFLMLFITFCRIDISELRLHHWHVYGLIFQTSLFCLLSLCTFLMNDTWRIITEGCMVCLICPTATAAAVVTYKLGGNAGGVTTYTILINLTTAFVVSAIVPLIHPQDGMTFIGDFTMIISKVMPLLFMPIIAAAVVRRWWKSLPEFFRAHPDLAFYIWCVALALAIAVTVRSIVRSNYPFLCEVGIAVSSALACVAQFAFGRLIGKQDQQTRITAGQSLGQKNTVFAIWMGYTFLDPITSIAGGFYSVWHNLYNSWQLYNKLK